MEKQCGKVRELLSLYIDDVLCDDEKEYVRDHLASCEGCRGEYEFLCGIINQAEQMPVLTVSDAMHSKIMQGIKCEQNKPIPPKRFRQNVWRMASGFAAAAAVIAISVISYSSLPKHPDLTTEPTTEIHETIPTSAPTNAPAVAGEKEQTADVTETVTEPVAKPEKRGNAKTTAKPSQPPKVEMAKPQKEVPPEVEKSAEETPAVSAETVPVEATASEDVAVEVAPAMEPLPAVIDEPIIEGEGDVQPVQGGRTLSSVTCYYIGDASYEEAVLILDAYEFDGMAYVVPAAEKEAVYAKLQALPGYVRSVAENDNGETVRIALMCE